MDQWLFQKKLGELFKRRKVNSKRAKENYQKEEKYVEEKGEKKQEWTREVKNEK